MTLLALRLIAVLLAVFLPADRQQDKETVTLEVRVATSSAGHAIVDRGAVDGLQKGDKIVFKPKGGDAVSGRVNEALERIAKVELEDRSVTLPAGTRGEVSFPKARLRKAEPPPRPKETPKPAAKEPAKPATTTKPATTGKTPAPAAKTPTNGATKPTAAPAAKGPEHPPWKNQDEGFTKGSPLLSQKPIRPEERGIDVSGRVYLQSDVVSDFHDGLSNSVSRLGGDVSVENPFGIGGALHLGVESAYRVESDGGHQLDFLMHELSYVYGGTRFDPQRLALGRFAQYGVPEFGVLDGAEWSRRTEGGDRFGASAGFMPEPDDDYQSFTDFQVAAWYQWVADDSERLSATIGYQKTFHDTAVDRDLVIAKIRATSLDGWDFNAVTWFDWYGSGSNQKDEDFEITQAVWSITKRWKGGDFLDLAFRSVKYPDIDRQGEFVYPLQDSIDDLKHDRLALSGNVWWGENVRLHSQAGIWGDEDDTGSFADAGFEVPMPFLEDGRIDFTGFGSIGQFERIVGARAGYNSAAQSGSWNVFYEVSQHQEDDFVDDLEFLIQQRAYVGRTFNFDNRWMLVVNGQLFVFDTDVAWSVGLFLQKSF